MLLVACSGPSPTARPSPWSPWSPSSPSSPGAAPPPDAPARDESTAPDVLHLAPLFKLARASAPNARTAVIAMLSPDDELRALAVNAAKRAGFETDAIAIDVRALAKSRLDVRVDALRAAGAGNMRDIVVVIDPEHAAPARRDWLDLPWAVLAGNGGVVVARWVEDGASAHAGAHEWGNAKVFVRSLGGDRVEHHAIVRASLGALPVPDAPRLGLLPLERGIDIDGRGASVSGYLVREDDGTIAIVSSSALPGRMTVRLRGTKGDELAQRIAGVTSFPLVGSGEHFDDPALLRTTMLEAMGNLGGDRLFITAPASPVVARVRGALRLKEWTEAGRVYELDAEEIEHTVDMVGWQRARERYRLSLARAARAFGRNDPKAAVRALADARDAIASEFLALAPSLEVYRFIDGLARRFDEAQRAIERGAGNVVGYADAVLPLGLVRMMNGRPYPSVPEREMVTAAYRFARRAVMRKLKAGEGNASALGRAIYDMASKVPQHDREMMLWVMNNVPGANTGFR